MEVVFQYNLVLFSARNQLPTLSIELSEAPGDALYTGVQLTVFVIFCIEVVLVALPLVDRRQRGVLPVNVSRNPSFSGPFQTDRILKDASWKLYNC